jgi:hypothetical protein
MAPNNEQRGSIVSAALELAASGRSIFPVGRDKKPQLNNWPNKASTDLEQIRTWFYKAYPSNIGLVTGEVSGVFVLDVDGAVGLANLSELENRHGVLPRDCVGAHIMAVTAIWSTIPVFCFVITMARKAGRLIP